MKSTIERKTSPKRKVEIHHVQLGNPFDTNGARLFEAFHVADVFFPRTGPRPIFLYNRHGVPYVALGQRCAIAPDFPEMQEEDRSYGYSTASLPVAYDPSVGGYDMEKQMGVSRRWLKNHWWMEEVEHLNPEPLKTNKR